MPAIVHLLCKHLHICSMSHLISRVLPKLQQPYRKIATHVLKKPIHDQKHQEDNSVKVWNEYQELSQNVLKRKTVREKVTKEAKPIPPVRIRSVRLSSPHPATYLRLNKTQLHRLPVKIHKLRDASTQVTPPPKLLRALSFHLRPPNWSQSLPFVLMIRIGLLTLWPHLLK